MLKQKWGVEVLSFEGNMSRTLRQISAGYFGRGRFVTLDQYYGSFVYLNGGAVLPERTCAELELLTVRWFSSPGRSRIFRSPMGIRR